MVSFISSWAQGIILAVIISCIIELILPEGNNKKYVKTVIGIYILFVIIYPLTPVISNKKIDINDAINGITDQISKFEGVDITLETNSYIEEIYIEKLQKDISQKLKEEGYNIDFLKLYIETENESIYGQINNVVLQVSKTKKLKQLDSGNTVENAVKEIETVDIEISNEKHIKSQNHSNTEKITDKEIETLKDYLNNAYGIAKEKIHINE